MEPDPVNAVGESQPWSITNTLKNVATFKTNKTRQKQQQKQPQSHDNPNEAATPQIVHDSSLSIYERVRHFLYINFVLNKKSFILSILSYLADLILFIALNLYLFSNKKFINEMICLPLFDEKADFSFNRIVIDVPSINSTNNNNSIISRITKRELLLNQVASDDFKSILNLNNNNFSSQFRNQQLQAASKSLKQSYLTLQIIIIFVFFICFILSYLIKLQFKYHRLALNLYDYDIELGGPLVSGGKILGNQPHDRDRESLASTTTASHFSSSANNSKKIVYLIKRLLNRLLTKLASILLNFFIGYQFCQNCFVQQPDEIKNDAYSIFIHIFILACVLFRSGIYILSKKNSMNQLNHLKKLQQKQKDLFDPKNSKNYPHRYYYYYYYSYLIRSSQNSSNQLKQHQTNQNTFRIFQLNDVSLFVGFLCALFHLFKFLKAFELIFVFLPMLFILILFRFKSLFNGCLNLFVLFISILIISTSSSFNSIEDISSFYLKNNELKTNLNGTLQQSVEGLPSNVTAISSVSPSNSVIVTPILFNKTDCNSDLHNIQNSSSIINLFSYNLLTFFCFLLTFYLKSLLSIYYCTLTSLERWNLSFLCKRSFSRKLLIYLSFLVYLIFAIACTISLCIKLTSWLFLILPFYIMLTFIWCSFQLLNTINLTHLMNKISDCFLLLNESNSISKTNSFENSSNISKKSRTTSHIYNPNNRNSCLSHSSSHFNTNNNNNNGQVGSASGGPSTPSSTFRFTKFLSRFLSYNKLNMMQQNDEDGLSVSASIATNVPIHRILAYKGVRHLGSISYRISLYCFVQTILLAPFAFYTSSPITIGLYLITLSLNFIWLSLLFQFPKTASGTCIAYSIVAPPLILNIYNAGTIGTQSSSASSNPTLNSSKKYRTGSSTTTSNTTNTFTTTTTGSSALFLPFNYQQALTQRCTFILNKMQSFLQFHLIENFGCDFAATGLQKALLETKLKAFFQKKYTDGSYYNTYVLYYCGPTSVLTDGLTFVDGDELSIEQIVENWKQVHCYASDEDFDDDSLSGKGKVNQNANGNESDNSNNNVIEVNKNKEDRLHPSSSTELNSKEIKTKKRVAKKNNSRLIIILDAEHTAKSLQYVKTKLRESNVYVALQTVKYNYNNGQFKNTKTTSGAKSGIENKLILGQKTSKNAKQTLMGPGSPQTISGSFFDTYLNIGKFTLDWIKSNCNAAYSFYENSNVNNELESLNQTENFLGGLNSLGNDFTEEREEDEEDEYRDEDDDDEDEEEDEELEQENQKSINLNKSPNSTTIFYETKCAFSRYWIDFKFDNTNDRTLAQDFNQFWHLYYPSFICKPLLKLINCRIFYLKFEFLKKIVFLLRRLKNRIIPMHEFDTGHGFKLFSS